MGAEGAIKAAETEAIAFIRKFGAYLQLHTSLSSAAAANASAPIKELLKLAKFDPTHREAMRDIKASGSLVFYDMVSFILFGVIQRFECVPSPPSDPFSKTAKTFRCHRTVELCSIPGEQATA